MISPKLLVAISLSAATLGVSACGASNSTNSTPSVRATSGQPTAASTHTTATVAIVPTFNLNGLLAGTAKPTFTAGAAGKVDVVYTAALVRSDNGSALLPIVIRNNTKQAISHIDVTAEARNASGVLAATGKSQETDPAQLAPGEAGLSFIYFETSSAVPAGATYSFSFETIPADTSSYNTSTVKVTEANQSGGSVVGTGTNTTGKAIQGPYSVEVYCFSTAGALTNTTGAFTDQSDNVPAGGNVSFTVPLYGTACPTFLVGITGYFA
jgi:hypothetical protein